MCERHATRGVPTFHEWPGTWRLRRSPFRLDPPRATGEVSQPTGGWMAKKEEAIQFEGTVTDVLPNSMFRVELPNGHSVLATVAGKMRQFRIRVIAGDRVSVEVSPYDLGRGRITFRHKV